MPEYVARYAHDPASVGLARHGVVDFARLCGFCPQDVADIESGVGEALSNAVEHSRGPRGLMRIRCRFDENTLIIEVRDNGAGFDPDCIPAPKPDYSTRGFGIFIMRTVMDAVHFERGGRMIRLVKRKRDDCSCRTEQRAAYQ